MEEPYEHSMDADNSGGGIRGTVQGEFRLYKTIRDTQVPFPGVKFELWKKDGGETCPGETKVILETDADGMADITDLPVGICYVKKVKALEKSPTGTKVQLYKNGAAYGEQIVLLSTCSYHTENGRFLLAARRIKAPDGETAE